MFSRRHISPSPLFTNACLHATIQEAGHCLLLTAQFWRRKKIESGFSFINEEVVTNVLLQYFWYPYWVLSTMLSVGDYVRFLPYSGTQNELFHISVSVLQIHSSFVHVPASRLKQKQTATLICLTLKPNGIRFRKGDLRKRFHLYWFEYM